MIGKVYLSRADYFDLRTNCTQKKTRPVLVVGGPNDNDYTVLPISTITLRQNVNSYYDILIPPQERATLSLNAECFIRTHKQMPLHRGAMLREIGDMKNNTPNLYLEAVSKMEEFQKNIVDYVL